MRSPFVYKAIVLALIANNSCYALAAETAAMHKTSQAKNQAASTLNIDIPAMPLTRALNQLAQSARIVVSFDPMLIKDKTSTAVKGRYTFDKAILKLLQGTSLSARKQSNGGYAIQRNDSDTKTLNQLEVIGNPLSMSEDTGSYTIKSMNTATGLNLSARETPQSVTVLTRQVIEDLNIRSVDGALALTPGVNTLSDGSGYSAYRVRGHTLDTLQVDGQTFNKLSDTETYLLSSFSTASIDHIEVVRGAAGLAIGSGNPSGVINIVRKHGGDEFAGSITGTKGNYDTYITELDIGGPLTSAGDIKARLVANYEEQKDHIKGHYNKQRPSLYGVLDADISENTTVSLALDYQAVDGDGLASYNSVPRQFEDGSLFNTSRSFNLSPDWEKADQQQDSVNISLNHSFLDNWNFLAAYTRRRGEYHYAFLTNKGISSDGSYSPRAIRNKEDVDTDAVNLKINGSFDLFGQTHEVVLGYISTKQETGNTFAIEGTKSAYRMFTTDPRIHNAFTFDPGKTPGISGWENISGADYKTEQSSIFASSRWQLADPFSVLAGFRLSDYKQNEISKTYYESAGGPPTPIAEPMIAAGHSYDHDNIFTPYLGMVYDFNEHISGYTSYTGIFQIQGDDVRDINGALLDPIESKNIELGLKGEFFKNKLNVSAAVFEVKQDNVAVKAGDHPADSVLGLQYGSYYRGEDGRISEGIEVEISGNITDNWQLIGGYTYQKLKNADGSTDTISPKDIIKLTTRYQFGGTLNNLAIGGSYHWQSGTTYAFNNQKYYADKFDLLGFWASYQFDPNLTARLNVHNLLDKEYVDNAAPHINYGEARRIYLSLNYNF